MGRASRASMWAKLAAAALLLVWANEVPTFPGGHGTSVLGAKVTRCTAGDGSRVVASGPRLVNAENAPLTVAVSGGRVASVLARPLKINPGGSSPPRLVRLTIGAPRVANGALTTTLTVRNLSDCSASLRLARGTAKRDGERAFAAQVLLGETDAAVVRAGERITGSVSFPLRGDGSYQISAAAYAEMGIVR